MPYIDLKPRIPLWLWYSIALVGSFCVMYTTLTIVDQWGEYDDMALYAGTSALFAISTLAFMEWGRVRALREQRTGRDPSSSEVA